MCSFTCYCFSSACIRTDTIRLVGKYLQTWAPIASWACLQETLQSMPLLQVAVFIPCVSSLFYFLRSRFSLTLSLTFNSLVLLWWRVCANIRDPVSSHLVHVFLKWYRTFLLLISLLPSSCSVVVERVFKISVFLFVPIVCMRKDPLFRIFPCLLCYQMVRSLPSSRLFN